MSALLQRLAGSTLRLRLTISLLGAVTIVVLLIVFTMTKSYVDWTSDTRKYNEWLSGPCPSLENERALLESHLPECMSEDDSTHTKCSIAMKHTAPESMNKLIAAGCGERIAYFYRSKAPKSPGEYKFFNDFLPELAIALTCVFAVCLLSVEMARIYVLEQHVGWRRVSIVAGGVIATMVALVAISTDLFFAYSWVQLALVLVTSFAAGILFIIGGRQMILWVRNGF